MIYTFNLMMPNVDLNFIGWLLIPFSMMYLLLNVVKGYFKKRVYTCYCRTNSSLLDYALKWSLIDIKTYKRKNLFL